jgi:hypothetical protein
MINEIPRVSTWGIPVINSMKWQKSKNLDIDVWLLRYSGKNTDAVRRIKKRIVTVALGGLTVTTNENKLLVYYRRGGRSVFTHGQLYNHTKNVFAKVGRFPTGSILGL